MRRITRRLCLSYRVVPSRLPTCSRSLRSHRRAGACCGDRCAGACSARRRRQTEPDLEVCFSDRISCAFAWTPPSVASPSSFAQSRGRSPRGGAHARRRRTTPRIQPSLACAKVSMVLAPAARPGPKRPAAGAARESAWPAASSEKRSIVDAVGAQARAAVWAMRAAHLDFCQCSKSAARS